MQLETIPEDIANAAREIANAVRTYRHNASQWEMVRDVAATALLAEREAQRERDAKIAEFATEFIPGLPSHHENNIRVAEDGKVARHIRSNTAAGTPE